MPKWLKISLKVTGGLILMVVLFVIGILLYITYNKDKVLKMVSSELNQRLDGRSLSATFSHSFLRIFQTYHWS